MISRRFHLVLDIENVNPDYLVDEDFIISLMSDIRDSVEMKFLTWPRVVSGTLENPGLTAFAIIDFSHISVHTFSATNEFCLDVFSCKPFDTNKLYELVRRHLKVSDQDIHRANVAYDR